jgi:hypothetical protein
MADASVPELSSILQEFPSIGRALQYLQQAHNNVAQQVNASPIGITPAPLPHSAISVKGGAGILDIAITDTTPQFRGKSNFIEISDNASYSNPHVVEIGAGRNWRQNVGPGEFHVRSYAAHPTSGPSDPIYHPAVSTVGGTEPAMQPGQGSGTGGGGYGSQPYTGVVVPKR